MSGFPTELQSIAEPLSDEEVRRLRRGEALRRSAQRKIIPVLRADGTAVSMRLLETVVKVGAGRFAADDRQASDAWFAPRLHWALRLTRRQAADPGLWEWLAYRFADLYVNWRWAARDGTVARNRFRGGINKQAFARLWWGAELFRNGNDYSPVQAFFQNQDYPNSYIQRAFVRNRPLALALLREIGLRTNGAPASDQINDVARTVNLWIAPLSVEAASGSWQPDFRAFEQWTFEEATEEVPRASLPDGPPDGLVSSEVLASVGEIAAEVCDAARVGSVDTHHGNEGVLGPDPFG